MIINNLERKISGRIKVPGDKSISHRSIMIAGISRGTSEIHGFLRSEDCLRTVECFRQLGVSIEERAQFIVVHGNGLQGLKEPGDVLDCGNSGTTARLLTGILAGQNFFSVLSGDPSLRSRPMRRVVDPLRMMGADVDGRMEGSCMPLAIRGENMKGIEYHLPMPSAQVKSAILLAGLYAPDQTIIWERVPSRDHTERMLKTFGSNIEVTESKIQLSGGLELTGQQVAIPGDISSAAFFIAAAAISPGSCLTIEGVGLNPTRTGILDVLQEMGAEIQIEGVENIDGEPVGDVTIRGRQLHGINIHNPVVPRLIDEIPILAVAAAFAEGTTRITDAAELKVKESNRIRIMVQELSKLGVRIRELPDGMEIVGPNKLHGAVVGSHGDHRVAMSLKICALFCPEPVTMQGAQCAAVSFPEFEQKLGEIVK